MLVSFLSFIISGTVFGHDLPISVDVCEEGAGRALLCVSSHCSHGIIVFHDIPFLSSWHVTALSFSTSSFFIFICQHVCHEYDKYVPKLFFNDLVILVSLVFMGDGSHVFLHVHKSTSTNLIRYCFLPHLLFLHMIMNLDLIFC